MRDGRPSFTAAFVATARTIGRSLPPDACIADDPYGARFAGPLVARIAERTPRLIAGLPFVLYMQVRTRAIDDAVRSFVEEGGRQVAILGAGFDCRAVRLDLGDSTVFEIDHPATQASKRATLASAGAESTRVRYVAWDFERDALEALPARLQEHGHDPERPTITIWEGVTMYLTEPAIDASLRAIRAFSAPGSKLVMTYFDRARIDRPSPYRRLVSRVVAGAGEPFRFGLHPTEVDAWLGARGFTLEKDRDSCELARDLLPPRYARRVRDRGAHIAIAAPR
jgi:methyltransferase (TIGR00027 family)